MCFVLSCGENLVWFLMLAWCNAMWCGLIVRYPSEVKGWSLQMLYVVDTDGIHTSSSCACVRVAAEGLASHRSEVARMHGFTFLVSHRGESENEDRLPEMNPRGVTIGLACWSLEEEDVDGVLGGICCCCCCC